MKKLLLPLLLFPLTVFAAPTKLSSTGGSVEFLALTRPGSIRIHGTGKPATSEIKVDGQKVSGTFEFDLTTLDTGMPKRNEHMNTHLQTKEFPKAKLTIADLTLPGPYKTGESMVESAPFTGTMELHGQKQPVKGTYNLKKDGTVVATFPIQMTAYKIDPPSFMGVTVKDDVDVTVNIAQLKETK